MLKVLRKYFITGFAAVLPLFITVYLVFFIIRSADSLVGDNINSYLMQRFGYEIPGLGLIFLVFFILVVGIFVSNFLGRKIFDFFEKLFAKTPLVAGIYPSAKQLVSFLFEEEKKDKFRRVVLVEYPTPGTYSIGFVTNEEYKGYNEKTDSRLTSVLVPLSPMPYSGMLLMLPDEKIIDIDMSVNDAIKVVFSGGVVVPGKK